MRIGYVEVLVLGILKRDISTTLDKIAPRVAHLITALYVYYDVEIVTFVSCTVIRPLELFPVAENVALRKLQRNRDSAEHSDSGEVSIIT